MTARRVGLTPTPADLSSASGWIAPATSQKAAAETSPGTRSSIARTVTPPSIGPRDPADRPGWPTSSRSTATPRARSIRSVWSRVATASRTVVRPSARSPARRIADFTCALGTGRRDVDRPERGVTDHGQGRKGIVRRAWSAAPIERSGSMIRATGRRRNEASPSRTAVIGRPARIPANRRRLVPELPQSRAAVGLAEAVRARRDDQVVDVPIVRRVGSARPARPPPRARCARSAAVERTSAPSPAPVIRLSPRGQRREHQRPMADRLVAGQAQLAAQPRGRAATVRERRARSTPPGAAARLERRSMLLARPLAARPAQGRHGGSPSWSGGPARGPGRAPPSGRANWSRVSCCSASESASSGRRVDLDHDAVGPDRDAAERQRLDQPALAGRVATGRR